MSTKSWCKVASNIDTNPKIMRGGRNCREVFLFALRRNAEPNNPVPGHLPETEMEPWYVARLLMMSESEALEGLSKCVEVGLLERDGAAWRIVGWGEAWGKLPSSGAERMRKLRERKAVTKSDDATVTDRHGDECDALDQIRSEEKRGESDAPAKRGTSARKRAPGKPGTPALDLPDPAAILADAAISEINRLGRTAYRPDSSETVKNCTALAAKGVTPEQAIAVIRFKASWVADARMRDHFKPSALLRPSNFERYLEDLQARSPRPANANRPAPIAADDAPDLTMCLIAEPLEEGGAA